MKRSSLTGSSEALAANMSGKSQAAVKKPRAKVTKPRAKPAAKPAKPRTKPTAKSTKKAKPTQQAKSTVKVEDDEEPGLFVEVEEPSAPVPTTTKAIPTPPPEPLEETAVTLALVCSNPPIRRDLLTPFRTLRRMKKSASSAKRNASSWELPRSRM